MKLIDKTNTKISRALMARIYLYGLLGEKQNLIKFGNYLGSSSDTSVSEKTMIWVFENNIQWQYRETITNLIQNTCNFYKDMKINKGIRLNKLCILAK